MREELKLHSNLAFFFIDVTMYARLFQADKRIRHRIADRNEIVDGITHDLSITKSARL